MFVDRQTHERKVADVCTNFLAVLREPESRLIRKLHDRHAMVRNRQAKEDAKGYLFVATPSITEIQQGLDLLAELLVGFDVDRRRTIEGEPSETDLFVTAAADVYERHAAGKIGLSPDSPFARFCQILGQLAGKKISGVQVKKSVGRWRSAQKLGSWPKYTKAEPRKKRSTDQKS